jgi:membrane-associated protease RseP (regulator of RpoE activity)
MYSRKRGETEYGIKWIPLGGYIRMIGMVPPRADGSRSRWPRRMATAIEDFRQVSRAEVAPGDEDREFYRLTPGKKMIVMLGGPMMNLIIYLLLSVVLLSTLGLPHTDPPTTKVAAVMQCVVPANSPDADSNTCPSGATPAPANGKIKPGDKIVAVNGTAITSWTQLVSITERSAGKTLKVTLLRNGSRHTIDITPVPNTVYADDTGTRTKKVGFLGISAYQPKYYAAVPVTQLPGKIADQIGQGLSAIGRYPQKIANLWDTVFGNKPRDINGAVGVVGIGRLGGDFASSQQIDVQDKVFLLVELLATVNLLLFFLNLLPLLPLDGGHVLGALVEAVKRGWARLRAPTPVPGADPSHAPARRQIFVDTAQMLPVMYAVGALLIFVSLLTFYADIFKPIHPFGG